MSILNKYWISLIVTGLILGLYYLFAYNIARHEFVGLLLLYGALFLLSGVLFRPVHLKDNHLIGIGVIARLLFIIALPNLSQDYFRFIWDGRLILAGINPYLFTPEDVWNLALLRDKIPQASELIEGMGILSANNYSNYPPINQLFFVIAALFSPNSCLGSVIVLRTFVIAADLGIVYFGRKILRKLNQSPRKIFFYFLNPFIIIELTGNLHFEGMMLFFLFWGMYLLMKNKLCLAALLIGLSISVKLLPLIFLPLFLKYFQLKTPLGDNVERKLDIKKLIVFYTAVGLTVAFSFLPFLSWQVFQNFIATTSLWFQKFEFNASIYYIFRWVGYKITGWNVIATAGKILSLLIFLVIVALSVFRKNNSLQSLLTSFLFSISLYLILSTTVHPWYLATPLLLSVFTRYRYMILWSFLVILSYSAYGKHGVTEKPLLLAIEYLPVIIYGIFEIFWKKRKVHIPFAS